MNPGIMQAEISSVQDLFSEKFVLFFVQLFENEVAKNNQLEYELWELFLKLNWELFLKR